MKNLFAILPADFFKPLTSKYRRQYADCILTIFNSFKPEISYGVDRNIVVNELENYYELDDRDMLLDDGKVITSAREKANATIQYLKACGWLEYEQEKNHHMNVVMYEYAIPVIESMNRIIREEEAEYQGIISIIHSTLANKELYSKPYELIIKGVAENSERLISELKRLNVSIKRHMDKQTADMSASEILEHFFEYHKNIGSKAYMRLKTSENISYFRGSILQRIDEIFDNTDVMDRAITGYMEVEQVEDRDMAYDRLIEILTNIKSVFYRLDEIIEEIDNKHATYMRNAVMRARFKLATGNNMEGKLQKVLDVLAERMNSGYEKEAEVTDTDMESEDAMSMFSFFPQNYIAPESLKTIPVSRGYVKVDDLSGMITMTETERAIYKEAMREKNRRRFSRKNINEYVSSLLGERERIKVSDIPLETKRDIIRMIYVSIYAGNRSNIYEIRRLGDRVKKLEYELPEFEIIRR